ncbi:MAG: hypothetical protein AAB574_02245 [Patescibacteria group bacterium]
MLQKVVVEAQGRHLLDGQWELVGGVRLSGDVFLRRGAIIFSRYEESADGSTGGQVVSSNGELIPPEITYRVRRVDS